MKRSSANTPSPAEAVSNGAAWQGRVDLAAVYRIAAMLGLDAGIDNHYTLVVPGDERRMLTHPYGLHFSEITASKLIAVQGDSDDSDTQGVAYKTTYHIHWSIHRARPDARCVLHTHQPHATALTMIENGRLDMAVQDCLRFWDRVAYLDSYGGNEVGADEGQQIVDALGDKDILFLKHHGLIICGPTVGEAFDDMFYLERACQALAIARQMGHVVPVPKEWARATGASFEAHPQWKELHFAAMKRVLDRDQPDYRN